MFQKMQNLQLEIALMSVQYQMITYFEKHQQLHVQSISISQKKLFFLYFHHSSPHGKPLSL